MLQKSLNAAVCGAPDSCAGALFRGTPKVESDYPNARLAKRAYWLIQLRWIAAISVAAGTYVGRWLLGVAVQSVALYSLAILLALYNMAILLVLNRYSKVNAGRNGAAIGRIVNFQICADLLILTVLLHFSGGIENPFVFFFIFHMIIASILLSVRESYMHAAFAVLLFGLLVLLEYLGLVEHHCLEGFVVGCSRQDAHFVLVTFFVFAVTVFLVVYMASYIAVRLRDAEQAAREAHAQLLEKDRIKDEYVFRVTHDIKGHLATIQNCLNLVATQTVGRVDLNAAAFVSRAYNRTKKLAYFVTTLLDLTRMRLSGKIEMSAFSLRDTVESAVASVESKACDKSIALSTNVEASLGQISGNQFSIEEVVTNLLMNAIKYTPEHGRVTLNVKDEGDHVLMEVADTGIGIPEDELGCIFDEFYRASNARETERDGTGLGLSIVKYVVERHGGQVQVESRLGHGAKFTLTLPKEPGRGQESPESDHRGSGRN